MKRVKSWLSILILTLMLCPMVVHAGSSSDVWSEMVVEDDAARMEVYSNGEVVDGYFEIQYDGDTVACTEDDVTFAETVGKFSVNVEDNLICVAVVSKEAIAEGVLFRVEFHPVDSGTKLTKNNVKATFYGEANSSEGKPLKSADTAEKRNGQNESSQSQLQEESKGNLKVIVPVLILVACCGILAVVVFIRKKAKA